MESIYIGKDGLPKQSFNGKEYTLYPKERYFSRGSKRMHTDVWIFHNGPVLKGFHVHHVNENTWDNRIENLECIEKFKHLSEHAKKKMQDESFKVRFYSLGIEAAKEWHKSPEGREWHRNHAKNFNFGHKEYGIRNCKHCQKEFTAKSSHASFCHNNCKSAWRRKNNPDLEQRICVICSKEFTTQRYNNSKTCSALCAKTSRKKTINDKQLLTNDH